MRHLIQRMALLVPLLAAPMSPLASEGEGGLARAELLEKGAAWNSLRLEPDVEGLRSLLDDDWLLTHSDGRVQDKTGYLSELAAGQRANQAIANHDVQVRLHGETAVVTGTSVQSGTRDGQPWSGRFRFTRVWVQQAHGWRMLASHSSRIAPRD